MDRRKLMTLLPFALLGTAAVALWISGMQISGTITATTGTQPDFVSFTENLNLSGVNYTFNKTYNNPDGDLVMTFSQDLSGISSTDVNCNFEEDEDVEFAVLADGAVGLEFQLLSGSPEVDLVNGDNIIQFRVSPHENRCALNGSYQIDGTIA